MAWTEKALFVYLSGTHDRVLLNGTESALKFRDKQYTAIKKKLPCI
jgi:transcriptional regulator of nitric oxide reductase